MGGAGCTMLYIVQRLTGFVFREVRSAGTLPHSNSLTFRAEVVQHFRFDPDWLRRSMVLFDGGWCTQS